MSLFFALVLIAIAVWVAAFVDGIPHLWHLFSLTPLWLMGLLGIGLMAWFVSDP